MLNTARSRRAMATAPHHLAAESALAVMREGGNAVEAMVAAAATIAVVYPHMNALGGDGFWLISLPGRSEPIAIDACGPAGANVDVSLYRDSGHRLIPDRGPLAANTVAGTVDGWRLALECAREAGGRMPRSRLLADAIDHAHAGIPVTVSQERMTTDKLPGLRDVPGFATAFLDAGGLPPRAASLWRQPRLGATLERIAETGPDDFYRGELGALIAADLERAGSPLTRADLERYRARFVEPLALPLRSGTVWNLPPPTQGLASLMILGIFERLGVAQGESFEHVHGLVEATKRAFLVRDREVGDPDVGRAFDPRRWLEPAVLAREADAVDRRVAAPWPPTAPGGDTVWMGTADRNGIVVSFIQSIYWEFGSGVVLDRSGVLWQNRGSSFELAGAGPRALAPGRRPFHTLNPAMARLADGTVLGYGTMGGEGQPQTQAAVFTRHVLYGQSLQAAVTAPRWLLGRTWGEETTTLKLEDRFADGLVDSLRDAGHRLELVAPFDDLMGHAGAVAWRPHGILEGAADPRGDGHPVGC